MINKNYKNPQMPRYNNPTNSLKKSIKLTKMLKLRKQNTRNKYKRSKIIYNWKLNRNTSQKRKKKKYKLN